MKFSKKLFLAMALAIVGVCGVIANPARAFLKKHSAVFTGDGLFKREAAFFSSEFAKISGKLDNPEALNDFFTSTWFHLLALKTDATPCDVKIACVIKAVEDFVIKGFSDAINAKLVTNMASLHCFNTHLNDARIAGRLMDLTEKLVETEKSALCSMVRAWATFHADSLFALFVKLNPASGAPAIQGSLLNPLNWLRKSPVGFAVAAAAAAAAAPAPAAEDPAIAAKKAEIVARKAAIASKEAELGKFWSVTVLPSSRAAMTALSTEIGQMRTDLARAEAELAVLVYSLTQAWFDHARALVSGAVGDERAEANRKDVLTRNLLDVSMAWVADSKNVTISMVEALRGVAVAAPAVTNYIMTLRTIAEMPTITGVYTLDDYMRAAWDAWKKSGDRAKHDAVICMTTIIDATDLIK